MATPITVLYPNETDATFNMDYYLTSHMPMVMEKLESHGMKGWRVSKLVSSLDGSPSKYSVCCTLEFGTAAEAQSGFGKEGGPIIEDIPNFSNTSPVIMVGEEVGSSKK